MTPSRSKAPRQAPVARSARPAAPSGDSDFARALHALDSRLEPRLEARRAKRATLETPSISRADLERVVASSSWAELVKALGPR